MIRRIAKHDLNGPVIPLSSEPAAELLRKARAREELIGTLEDELVDVLTRATTRVVHEELRLAPEHIRAIARDELTKLARAKAILAFVHPEDAPLLDALHDDATLPSFEIHADATLSRGDCVLSASLGDIDARTHTKLAHFAALLREKTP